MFICICDLQIGHLKKGINPLSVSDLAFGSPYLSSAIKTGIITGIIGLAVSIKQYNFLHMHQMLIAWHLAPLLINEILIFIICALLTCTGWNAELMRDYFKTNSGYIQSFNVYSHMFNFCHILKLCQLQYWSQVLPFYNTHYTLISSRNIENKTNPYVATINIEGTHMMKIAWSPTNIVY